MNFVKIKCLFLSMVSYIETLEIATQREGNEGDVFTALACFVLAIELSKQ